MRKLRGNGERMRKWRKNEEMDREICVYAQNQERAETVGERESLKRWKHWQNN